MGTAFILAAVAAAIAVLGWRGVRREHRRVAEALKRAEAAVDRRAPMTLEKDPETGIYRPKQ